MRLEDGFRNEFGNDLLSAEQPSVEALNALGRRVHFGKFEVDVPLNRSNHKSGLAQKGLTDS